LEGKATGTETGFGVSPTYNEINWTGLDFSLAQFDSVTSMNKADWKAEIALHTELFTQLAYHLPKELEETKTQLEQRLAA
jgi:phosphoenolpyruvate carboxykinase (GTP)